MGTVRRGSAPPRDSKGRSRRASPSGSPCLLRQPSPRLSSSAQGPWTEPLCHTGCPQPPRLPWQDRIFHPHSHTCLKQGGAIARAGSTGRDRDRLQMCTHGCTQVGTKPGGLLARQRSSPLQGEHCSSTRPSPLPPPLPMPCQRPARPPQHPCLFGRLHSRSFSPHHHHVPLWCAKPLPKRHLQQDPVAGPWGTPPSTISGCVPAAGGLGAAPLYGYNRLQTPSLHPIPTPCDGPL